MRILASPDRLRSLYSKEMPSPQVTHVFPNTVSVSESTQVVVRGHRI